MNICYSSFHQFSYKLLQLGASCSSSCHMQLYCQQIHKLIPVRKRVFISLRTTGSSEASDCQCGEKISQADNHTEAHHRMSKLWTNLHRTQNFMEALWKFKLTWEVDVCNSDASEKEQDGVTSTEFRLLLVELMLERWGWVSDGGRREAECRHGDAIARAPELGGLSIIRLEECIPGTDQIIHPDLREHYHSSRRYYFVKTTDSGGWKLWMKSVNPPQFSLLSQNVWANFWYETCGSTSKERPHY